MLVDLDSDIGHIFISLSKGCYSDKAEKVSEMTLTAMKVMHIVSRVISIAAIFSKMSQFHFISYAFLSSMSLLSLAIIPFTFDEQEIKREKSYKDWINRFSFLTPKGQRLYLTGYFLDKINTNCLDLVMLNSNYLRDVYFFSKSFFMCIEIIEASIRGCNHLQRFLEPSAKM